MKLIKGAKTELKLLENIEKGLAFKKNQVVKWRCRNWGYIHEEFEAPQRCPSCDHPQAFFELFVENY